MAIYKCKMCGGDLDVAEGVTVVECEYCGTKQTVPTSNDEEIRNLFNRANLLRRKCEFDKAEELYEKILGKDEKQSEAYWCVLLCRYGIEYVEDPKTDKRVPTCHRTSFEAITSDEYYKLALKYSDTVQKKVYEEEAKYIDGVQKEILAISQKEEPYDVFICYKETDENGKRTEDSVIANDIYYQLTQEGYKVFYAAITLEDKLGSAYEPIIFAALHSSKVMLALGTKPEYFNAVWVKNEWSRYLKLMKTDKKKQLIPCYRGMDAYELPEEFAHLQAQDMGKIGFINDLVRGIKKVIPKEEPKKETPKETAATAGIKSLLQRMDLFLEDGDWAHAKEYAEKVLDIDPQNAEAYLGELLAEVKITNLYELYLHTKPIEDLPLFQKAYRFADKELKAKLDDAIEKNEKFIESKRVSDVYTMACAQEAIGKTETDFLAVGNLFESISGYKDSAERAKRCNEKAEMAREEALLAVYQAACAKLESDDPKAVTSACELFRSIPEYRDSDEKVIACSEKLAELDRLAAERAAAAKKRKKRALIIGSSVAAALVAATVVSVLVVNRNETVAKAGLMYSLSSDGSYYTVSGVDDRTLEEYTIPETYHGKPVKGIAPRAFWECKNLTTITIPDNVTTIGDQAFTGCNALASVTIGSGVTAIGDSVFYDCKNLAQINISDLLAWCRIDMKVNSFYFPYNLYLNGAEINALQIPKEITEIKACTFKGCRSFTSVTIPDNVATIGSSAFSECDGLTSVAIPNSVTTIGSNAFSGCDSLANITIPSKVTTIEDGIFSGCIGLKDFAIPANVKRIGERAFWGCYSLASITIPNSITEIGAKAFSDCNGLETVHWDAPNCTYTYGTSFSNHESVFSGCAALTTVIIGNEVRQLPDDFLRGCTAVTDVTIGSGVTSIGSNAFSGCNDLKIITIPDNVTKIGGSAFNDCGSLTDITLPFVGTMKGDNANCCFYAIFGRDPASVPTSLKKVTVTSVTDIGDNAFSDCSSLTSITFLKNITEIGANAFSGCSSLNHFTISSSVITIGAKAFSGCNGLISITIPSGTTEIGENAFSSCSMLQTVYWNAQNCIYTYESSYGSHGSVFSDCAALTTVIIGNGVQQLPENFLRGCSAVTNITIGSDLTSIERYAFSGCGNLAQVMIPDKVKKIGDYAFNGCIGLTDVTIPDSVTEIRYDAFSDCSGLESVTIGSGVTTIGMRAFSSCSHLTNAFFRDPNGWKYFPLHASSYSQSISPSLLSDPISAANFLANSHAEYEWQKN